VNTPSLVLFKVLDSTKYRLSISDPDMRRPSGADTDGLTTTIVNTSSASFNYEIILNGLYDLDGINTGVNLTNIGNTTKLALTVIDGKTYPIALKSLTSGIETIKSGSAFQLRSTGVENNFIILARYNQKINIVIHSIDGKMVSIISNVQTPYCLKVNGLKKGLYVVSVNNETEYLNKKIVVK
jgi:hypothetical protein